MSQFFVGFFRAILEEWRLFIDNFLHWQDPTARLENQLRIMYGRGEISKERFLELRYKLHLGQISKGDIILVHREAVRRLEVQGKLIPGGVNPQIEHSLDRLYIDRALVEETRSAMEAKKNALISEANWVKGQAESARENAQSSLPDEAAARTYLEIWQHMLDLSRNIDQRLGSLSQELRRIYALEAELSAYITELRLLESQENVAEIKLHIRDDLLSQRELSLHELDKRW